MGMSISIVHWNINQKYLKHSFAKIKLSNLTPTLSSIYSYRWKLPSFTSTHPKLVALGSYKTISDVIFHLAGSEDFISNMVTYGRYFITVMLGTTYMMIKPVTTLFNDRLTGFLAICALGGVIYFVYFTLYSMLGLINTF